MRGFTINASAELCCTRRRGMDAETRRRVIDQVETLVRRNALRRRLEGAELRGSPLTDLRAQRREDELRDDVHLRRSPMTEARR